MSRREIVRRPVSPERPTRPSAAAAAGSVVFAQGVSSKTHGGPSKYPQLKDGQLHTGGYYLRKRPPNEAALLRLGCNAIASVAAEHFNGRLGSNCRESGQLLHLSMAILALARVVGLLRHKLDDANEI
jgi:hypothetical protein